MFGRPGVNRVSGHEGARRGVVLLSSSSWLLVVASMNVARVGGEAASLTYGPQACIVWPGDRMMDGLTPAPGRSAAARSHWAASAVPQPAATVTRSDKDVLGAGRWC